MMPRTKLLKLTAAVAPAAILAAGLYFAVRPAMESSTAPVDNGPTIDWAIEWTGERSIWPEPGHSVELLYESDGCFHSDRQSIELVGAQPDRVYLGTDGPTQQTRWAALSDDARRDMDATFAYLHNPAKSGCTTVDHVTITWKLGERIYATKELRDPTCQLGDEGMPRTLGQIIDELFPSDEEG